MQRLAACAFLLLGSAMFASCASDDESLPSDFPEPAAPTAEHAWLQQLVGEWTVKLDTLQAGATPAQASETVRSIGGLWVVGEGQASDGERSRHSMITLGFDPSKSAFVGTWVDSTAPILWIYSGTLDETRKILTLETRGPAEDPTKTALYRDAIEIQSADRRFLTSSMQREDGTWETFQRAEYQRKQ